MNMQRTSAPIPIPMTILMHTRHGIMSMESEKPWDETETQMVEEMTIASSIP